LRSNRELHYKIEQQQQEIEASSRYIEILTDNLIERGTISHSGHLEHLNTKEEEDVEEQKETTSNLKDKRNKMFIPDIVPVIGQYVVSQGFKEGHPAVDLAASLGVQVVSAATGEILEVKEDKYFGNMIVIDHLNGIMTVYAHLAKTLVEENDIVKKGMAIGLVGNTGNSTGPHLHFEILNNGVAEDPTGFIDF